MFKYLQKASEMLNYIIGATKETRWIPQSNEKVRMVIGWNCGYHGRIVSPSKTPGMYVVRLDNGDEIVAHWYYMEPV